MIKELTRAFAIPIFKCRLADRAALDRQMEAMILAREQGDEGISISNVNSWHSRKDFHLWPEACVQSLVDDMRAALKALLNELYGAEGEALSGGWQVEVWANITRRGGYNRAHDHTANGSIWSGIYYAKTGADGENFAPATGGRTFFENRSMVPLPRSDNQGCDMRELSIVPEQGLMVIFPSSLRHYVEPYRGGDVRISVAFNFRHPSFYVPLYGDMKEPTWLWRNFRGVMVCYAWLLKRRGRLGGRRS